MQQLLFKIFKNTLFLQDTHRVQFQLVAFNIHSKILLKNNLFKCSLEPSSASFVLHKYL